MVVEPKQETADANISDSSTKEENVTAAAVTEEADDDDDEYEYIEYDVLTEKEFTNSEWLVGTNWDRNPQKIDETWCRLVFDKDDKPVAIWGDRSRGTWKLDVATQFLSISKESLWAGKEIWACTVSDYYYLQGTVRGWKYWAAAEVMGQWQAKRLGLSDKDEAGTPPWFMEEEEETGGDESSSALSSSAQQEKEDGEASSL